MPRMVKKERLVRLSEEIEKNPFLRDEELSEMFDVSIQTIRLDRMSLNIPELRERMKSVATEMHDKVKTLSRGEIVGELIDLQLNQSGISFLETDKDMVFTKTQIVKGHYIFALAESLAMAVIDAPVAITGVANIKYNVPVFAEQRLIAKANVTRIRDNKEYYVHVMVNVGDNQVFRSKFILTAIDVEGAKNENSN
ncbi:transcription factor FapR [Acidaminobacter sp. JC074]|uniref:transcription factor FapR n=1 Tax=Acidaminobacter sp. JC074 TaxID=2530199 RepID=UPI001F1065DC|nr:transcription factor FapR [Acidaminobacter sp. JC074]MCH4888346.1 transcription factor FapR [Acidaminobacter sp. JC074]